MPLYSKPIASEQNVVQARRTTEFEVTSGAFTDIEFDTTDVQSASAYLEHDLTFRQRFNIKTAGNYLVNCFLNAVPFDTDSINVQSKKNGNDIIDGSVQNIIFNVLEANPKNVGVQFIAPLTAGEYITIQANSDTGSGEILSGAVVSIVHLAGPKGDRGSASANDTDAIHKSTGAEIQGLTEKTTPVANDLLLMEDSEVSHIKKKLKIGNLPGGATLSDVAPVNATKDTASAGVAAEASRQDHKHDVSTAVPPAGSIAAGNTASEGSASTLSRSDHRHAVSVASPASVGTANNAGVANTFVRSDHVHAGLTRGAADFNSFVAKTIVNNNDILLIEDSEDASNKKKITIASLANVGTVQTTVHDNSGKWESTYSTMLAESGDWESIQSFVESSSGGWDSVLSTTQSNSGKWESVHSTVGSNSGKWESAFATVSSISANTNCFLTVSAGIDTTVCTNSNTWYKASFTSTSFDGTSFTNDNNKITFIKDVAQDCLMSIAINISSSTANRTFRVAIVKNGSIGAPIAAMSQRFTASGVPWAIPLTALATNVQKDDYFEIWYNCTSAGNTTFTTNEVFWSIIKWK